MRPPDGRPAARGGCGSRSNHTRAILPAEQEGKTKRHATHGRLAQATNGLDLGPRARDPYDPGGACFAPQNASRAAAVRARVRARSCTTRRGQHTFAYTRQASNRAVYHRAKRATGFGSRPRTKVRFALSVTNPTNKSFRSLPLRFFVFLCFPFVFLFCIIIIVIIITIISIIIIIIIIIIVIIIIVIINPNILLLIASDY